MKKMLWIATMTLIALGVAKGDMVRVRGKASRICLECIGIG